MQSLDRDFHVQLQVYLQMSLQKLTIRVDQLFQ